MVHILLMWNQLRESTAKYSEPQVYDSDVMDEGSGVAKFSWLRTETELGLAVG